MLHETYFLLNSTFYNQSDGIAMGSPSAPVLACIFIGYNRTRWLNEYFLNKPKFYLRYVDDILDSFNNKQDSLIFFNFLNEKHSIIKFTIENKLTISWLFLINSFHVSKMKI